MNSTSVDDPYKFDYKFHKSLLYSIVAFFTVLGVFGNVNIVILYLRKRSLKNKYGTLLAILSFCQTFCLLWEWVGNGYSLSGYLIKRNLCFHLLFCYVFLHCMQTGLLATISLDLMISVLLPVLHRNSRIHVYIPVICTPTVCYGFISVFLGFWLVDDESLNMCNPPSSLKGYANTFWYLGALIAGGITIFNYAVTYVYIHFKSKSSIREPMEGEKRAMRSISAMLFVYVFARYIGIIVTNLMAAFKLHKAIITLYQDYNVIFAVICYSQNYYMSYWRSTEYRRLLREQLIRMLNCVFPCCHYEIPTSAHNTQTRSMATTFVKI